MQKKVRYLIFPKVIFFSTHTKVEQEKEKEDFNTCF